MLQFWSLFSITLMFNTVSNKRFKTLMAMQAHLRVIFAANEANDHTEDKK